MQIQLETQPYSSFLADALVTYVFDHDNKLDGVGGDINHAMNGQLGSLLESGELTGKALELVLIHFPQGCGAQRLLLVGAGKPGKFATSDLRKIAGTALRHLKSRGVKKVVVSHARRRARPERGAGRRRRTDRGGFRIGQVPYREKGSAKFSPFRSLGFDAGLGANLADAIEHGRVIAESAEFCARFDQ